MFSMFIIISLVLALIAAIVFLVVFFRKNRQLQNTLLQVLREVSIEVDSRDPYFNGHSGRVARQAVEIGKRLKFSGKKLFNLETAVYISELGKLRIPENILRKREKLTNEEYAFIKKHPIVGSKIVEDIADMKNVAEIIKYHHERYDGNGYPEGLLGDSIPIESRIINLLDAYDAMTSARPYRDPLNENQAIEEIENQKEKQFDSKLVELFVEIIKKR